MNKQDGIELPKIQNMNTLSIYTERTSGITCISNYFWVMYN